MTSFKRDSPASVTPVWFVSDGRQLFALTDLHAAKVRRGVLTATPDLKRVQKLLIERYKLSYRLVMLFYRLGRRFRGQRSVADGAALAITVE